MDLKEGRALFTGDAVFAEGELFHSNLETSSLSDYRRHNHHFADLAVDMLLPGHGVFRLSGGQRDLDSAIANLKKIRVPANFV